MDVIQTEGGKYSSPTKSGILGLIEKVYEYRFPGFYKLHVGLSLG